MFESVPVRNPRMLYAVYRRPSRKSGSGISVVETEISSGRTIIPTPRTAKIPADAPIDITSGA
ncbi:MAG: hypothetical protein ABIA21_04040 [Candidatus Aenigmatarchaeota archaeon]